MSKSILTKRQKIYLLFKRFFDILFSFLAITVFCWVFLIIAIIIKCTSKGPILFKQRRVGKNCKEFNILKFRTMKIDTPKNVPTHMLNNPDIYITKIGKFLRKTSLDEIPQAFNIFIGQMSIIGPRPALYNQYDLIKEREKYHANDVLPGLSGYAQLNGRDTITIPEKARLDGVYIQKFNLWFDIYLILKSIFIAFSGKDEQEGKVK